MPGYQTPRFYGPRINAGYADAMSLGQQTAAPATVTNLRVRRSATIDQDATVKRQLKLTVATGTAPMTVASTTVVTNLNVSYLLGATWASPSAIGSVTPAAGTFTTVNANSVTASGAIAGQTVQATAGFGCNGATPQGAYSLPADATDEASAVTLVNAIKAALIANGIGA